MIDRQITVELDVFLRCLDGGGHIGGGHISGGDARDGQEDDHSCFQQDHFVKIFTMSVMNMRVWYCVRTTIQRMKEPSEKLNADESSDYVTIRQ